MKILHLCSYSLYSGPLPGVRGLALAQRRAGHDVAVAWDTKRGAFNPYEEAADPWFMNLELGPSLPLTLSAKSTPMEWLRDRQYLRELVRDGVDVVHTHLSHDHTLWALSRPGGFEGICVRTVHAERSLEPRFGQRWLNQSAQGWITRCEAHDHRLASVLGVEETPRALIPGSIDADVFVPQLYENRLEARARFGIGPDVPLIGHAALIANRGQVELLEAAELLGESAPHILYIGSGEGEEALHQRVAQSPIRDNVHFAGYLQGNDLLVGYAAVDAAFCAQAGNDASVRAALEAMACSLPVLAVQHGALVDTVDESRGWPIAERSAASISVALADWAASEDLGELRGQAGRRYVMESRSFATEASQTLALYERCLG
ncbi:MAG: glycosyltransferase family 4 protein [Myxococcota bacterium]|nr:glycosyltransferase family 4 protein [Myxococcota bacterium]